MTGKEFINQLANYSIDKQKVKSIEDKYDTNLPILIKQLISHCDDPIFLDDYRVLSFSEIIEPENWVGIDFNKLEIIPLIDCGNNDFIVFHFNTAKWSLFNIVDKCSFLEKDTIDELIEINNI